MAHAAVRYDWKTEAMEVILYCACCDGVFTVIFLFVWRWLLVRIVSFAFDNGG